MRFVKENKKLIAFIIIMTLAFGTLTGMYIYESRTNKKTTDRLGTDSASYSQENENLKTQLEVMQSQLDEISAALDKSAENEINLQREKAELEKKIAELEKELGKSSALSKDVEKDKKVYLTFDDGPSANTPKILEILKEYGVKATFFVINGKNNQYMKNIVDEGHAIALHTYSHDYSKIYASDAAFFDDLQKISDVVKEQTGKEVKITRFPGGSSNGISKKYNSGIMTRLTKQLTEKGYIYYDWNCSIEDAVKGAPIPVDKLMSNLKSTFGSKQGHTIVLMHDTTKLTTTVEALPKIINFFKEKGFTFEIITENTVPVQHKPNN